MNDPALGPEPAVAARLQQLAEAHQTPFYVYDLTIFEDRIEALRKALPTGSRLAYSAKANPHAKLLSAAAVADCELELASPGELNQALGAGLDPANALFVGPAKSTAILSAALRAGIGMLVVESVGELQRLEKVATEMAVADLPVLLRLNLHGAKGMLRMSGHQFGMELDDIKLCYSALKSSPALRFVGYHGYLASQLLDAAEITHNARLVLDAVDTLTDELGTEPQIVDLGGGFGIRYTSAERQVDLSAVAEGLAQVAQRRKWRAPELLFESGRFLAGPAGALVCRVIDTKTVGGRRFVLVDAGTNSSGIFGGQKAVRNLAHNVIRDGVVLSGGTLANICGPLCTPMDRLATSVPCLAREGDLLVWWNMGAYGLTAAPTAFLSFPAPGEVIM